MQYVLLGYRKLNTLFCNLYVLSTVCYDMCMHISFPSGNMAMSNTFMLLVDIIGYKPSKSWYNRAPAEERVLRGTLLVGLTETEAKDTRQLFDHALNYKTLSDAAAQLFCAPEEVYPLTLQHKELLQGIKSPFDRCRMSKCLKWAEKLTVGDDVQVTIKSIPSSIKGVIRYIGALPEEDGTKFGIELMVCCSVINYRCEDLH